jgi:DNA-binding transcriptional regulator/RsmH inhibitor MraZ
MNDYILSIPFDFQKDLSKHAYISYGSEEVLFLYTEKEIKALERSPNIQKTLELPITSDYQISIPYGLKSKANMPDSVVFLKTPTKIEIWGKSKFKKYINADGTLSKELPEHSAAIEIVCEHIQFHRDTVTPVKNVESKKEKVSLLAIRRDLRHLEDRSALPMIIFCVYFFIRIIISGFNGNTFLFIGCLLSLITIYVNRWLTENYTFQNKKTFIALLFIPLGLFSWLFWCYLIFYKGLWSLTMLKHHFSFIIIIKSIIYTVFGYITLNYFYKLTEIERSIRHGKFEIIKEDKK